MYIPFVHVIPRGNNLAMGQSPRYESGGAGSGSQVVVIEREPTVLFLSQPLQYRVVHKKGTVLLSTTLMLSRAETFSQLRSISFA